MAKKKLTLEDVLVPKEEIPYEVPKNWCWVKLGSIVLETSSGFACAKRYEVNKDDDEAYPHLRPNNIGYYGKLNLDKVVYIPKDKVDVKKSTLQKGTILFNNTNSTELVGRSILIEEDMNYAFSNHITRVLVNEEICRPEWLNYAINYNWVQGLFAKICKQWVGQSGVNQDVLNKDVYVPIPPLSEQVRIVNRIESLFDKVDKASELVDEARDGFEKRRASILERAFCGELTRKWREENGVSDEWSDGIFEDLCVLKRGYDLPSYNRVSGAYSLVSSSGINDTHNEYKVEGPGITVGRSGSVGKVFYVEGNFWPLNTTLYVQNFKENDTKYVYYYLSNFNFKPYSSSTAVPTLNRNNFKNVPVRIPSLDEQKEIVRVLDSALSKEKEIDEISNIKENIDIIKKSILAKVFRGELGSNDLDEESSIELLKQLIK